jgi:ferrous iron transport protein B
MDEKKIDIVLAGQGNCGKSSIFNYLTGLHQHTGNWAGKTIEKREGTLFYKGYTIDVLDLPAIYSLTTYSVEEKISREYIVHQKPDVVINIIDSVNLERSLIFTLQLLELECPVILVLNMMDIAKRKGIAVDIRKLKDLINVPVVGSIASRGFGLTEIIDRVIALKETKDGHSTLSFGKEIENCISKLCEELKDIEFPYPSRWIAIKLIEKDNDITKLVEEKSSRLPIYAKQLGDKLEEIHGHDSAIVIADERIHLASRIISKTVRITPSAKTPLSDRLDAVTTNKFTGYIIMILILGSMFLTVFGFGNWLSLRLDHAFKQLHEWWNTIAGVTVLTSLGWAAIESVIALVQIALPYILPFYILLYILEDWGYIARISFLMDNLMHRMGIHGKGCISFIIGLGCNVPGCLSCRIMETRRERFITAVLVTFVPCSAVSVIIFGLVGKYIGFLWAMGLYLFAASVIFLAGRLSSKLVIGEPVELIMPMPDYKIPQLKTILIQTWDALKEFIYIAAPVVIVSGVVIQAINLAGWMPAISSFLNPVTVSWLGLPEITGILLIFGVLRKELILVMLAAYLGTANFGDALTSRQMLTLAIVSMFYVPCVATISVLWKDYGWKKAMAVCVIEIVFAILLAGIINKLLGFVL